MRVSQILPVVALVVGPLIPHAAACVMCACVRARTPLDARWHAHAVFSGRVVEIVDQIVPPFDTTLRDTTRRHELVSAYLNWTLERRQVAIEVRRVWKGDLRTRVEIFTGPNPDQCGFAFEVGKEYLVYVHRAQTGRWRTSICMRTRPLAEAATDLAALGPGVAPRVTSKSGGPPHN